MSYKDLYWARRLSNSLGFARRLWMFKLPRVADSAAGTTLLGSLVEEVNRKDILDLDIEYPLPFSMTRPQILLERLNVERVRLGLSSSDKLVFSQGVSSAVLSAKGSNNLSVDTNAVLPGIPISLSLSISNTKLAKASLTLNDGAEIQYIPTDYMARFSSLFGGKDELAFPGVVVDVEDNLFVDLVLLAKNYSMVYEYESKLDSRVDAEINTLNTTLGPKFEISKSTEFSVEVKVKEDVSYVLGFKTIDWDDLDF